MDREAWWITRQRAGHDLVTEHELLHWLHVQFLNDINYDSNNVTDIPQHPDNPLMH